MSLLPQITKQYTATPITGGFWLAVTWKYDPGMLPYQDADETLDEIDSILAGTPLLEYVANYFPEEIPASTVFPHAAGGDFVTEALSYIKEYYLNDNANYGYDDPGPEYVLVYACRARYSYTQAGDPLDKEAPAEYTPIQYPEGTIDYVPLNFPGGLWFSYFRWVNVAYHSATGMNVRSPWGILFRPTTTSAYDLIQYSPYTAGAFVPQSEYANWIALEGHDFSISLSNILTEYAFTWRTINEGGVNITDVWLAPTPPDGENEGEGFYFPRPIRRADVIAPVLVGSVCLCDFLLGTNFSSVAKLIHARGKPSILGSGTSVLGSGTSVLGGDAY